MSLTLRNGFCRNKPGNALRVFTFSIPLRKSDLQLLADPLTDFVNAPE